MSRSHEFKKRYADLPSIKPASRFACEALFYASLSVFAIVFLVVYSL